MRLYLILSEKLLPVASGKCSGKESKQATCSVVGAKWEEAACSPIEAARGVRASKFLWLAGSLCVRNEPVGVPRQRHAPNAASVFATCTPNRASCATRYFAAHASRSIWISLTRNRHCRQFLKSSSVGPELHSDSLRYRSMQYASGLCAVEYPVRLDFDKL